jgi:hypothetical protein
VPLSGSQYDTLARTKGRILAPREAPNDVNISVIAISVIACPTQTAIPPSFFPKNVHHTGLNPIWSRDNHLLQVTGHGSAGGRCYYPKTERAN